MRLGQIAQSAGISVKLLHRGTAGAELGQQRLVKVVVSIRHFVLVMCTAQFGARLAVSLPGRPPLRYPFKAVDQDLCQSSRALQYVRRQCVTSS